MKAEQKPYFVVVVYLFCSYFFWKEREEMEKTEKMARKYKRQCWVHWTWNRFGFFPGDLLLLSMDLFVYLPKYKKKCREKWGPSSVGSEKVSFWTDFEHYLFCMNIEILSSLFFCYLLFLFIPFFWCVSGTLQILFQVKLWPLKIIFKVSGVGWRNGVFHYQWLQCEVYQRRWDGLTSLAFILPP